MTIRVEVFTSNSCPHCPAAVKVAEEAKNAINADIDIEVVDINNPDNRQRAMDYQIMAVPTIAINNKVEFVGAPSKEQMIDKVNYILEHPNETNPVM